MKRSLTLLAIIAAGAIATKNAEARSKLPFSVGIEPIVGYERVQKLVPTVHSRDRLIYGARLTAGILLISAEAEYLRGTDTESFPDQDLTVKDTADKAKLGLRSTISFGGILSLVLRAGAQASQNKHEETTGGVTTSTTEAIKYRPYGGGGLRLGLGRNISLTGDIVAVFPSHFPNNMQNNEYQTTLGFTVRFP